MPAVSGLSAAVTNGLRYGIAFSSVAAALLSTRLLWPWIDPHPTPLFLAAVAVSAWYGGLGPSLLATALSALSLDYFFIPPLYALEISLDNTVGAVVFVLVALLISGIDAARQRAIEERNRMIAREQAARREVEAAGRARDEFLAMVTHELRTPLGVILGWAYAMRRGGLDGAVYERAVGSIVRNAEAQKHLIDDLLDMARITAGKFRVEARPMELVPVIEAAIEAVSLAAQSRNIRIQAVYDRAGALICGDPDRLQQVAWNLLSNAIKFTPEGGCVRVRVEQGRQHARIIVSDNGRGISAEFLPHVFERFRQHEGVSVREQGGLGLGLAIVRHLVEVHGGTVRAESAGEGRGATFTVTLPLMAAPEESACVKASAATLLPG